MRVVLTTGELDGGAATKACNETKSTADDRKALQVQSTAELREASSLLKELKELMACGGAGAPTPTGLAGIGGFDNAATSACAPPYRDKCRELVPDHMERGSTAGFGDVIDILLSMP